MKIILAVIIAFFSYVVYGVLRIFYVIQALRANKQRYEQETTIYFGELSVIDGQMAEVMEKHRKKMTELEPNNKDIPKLAESVAALEIAQRRIARMTKYNMFLRESGKEMDEILARIPWPCKKSN